jgi:hypothetical protein
MAKRSKVSNDSNVQFANKRLRKLLTRLPIVARSVRQRCIKSCNCLFEGVSIRGISRITGRALGTVTQIASQASQKAQMVHNQEVNGVAVEAILADEMWSFVEKNKPTAR